MIDYFVRLFHHDQWANTRQLDVLPGIIDAQPKALTIMSHIIMVERLWFHRITGLGIKPATWDVVPLLDLKQHCAEVTADWIKYLGSKTDADLDHMVSYHNFKGILYQNSVRDIVTQTISHSSHHRGQINLLIRTAGQEPPLLDYIAFARHEFE